MGGDRRAQGSLGLTLPRHFDLRARADEFAGEISDLLNNTVTDGIRITAVTDQRGQQAVIGYSISPQNLAEPKMIPLAVKKRPRLYLGMLFRMGPDDARQYPMVHSSVIYLSPDADGERVLLHYDYEREKDAYPEAHLQVVATSEAWEKATSQAWDDEASAYVPRARALERLHLPVGVRRFRSTVEDMIEFLVTEKLVEHRDNWDEHVANGRRLFEERQLRAAVRRNPEAALAILREEGHIR